MNTSLLMLLFGFAAFVIAAPAKESLSLPDDIDGYYRDFNELTLHECQPAKGDFSAPQAFTLQDSSSPEVGAVEILHQRLLERRSKVDPKFHQGLPGVISHERVFVRVADVRRSGDRLVVRCEIYESALPLPEISSDLLAQAAVAALDFTRLKLLRRETHHWRQDGGEWMLHGTVQELASIEDRSSVRYGAWVGS